MDVPCAGTVTVDGKIIVINTLLDDCSVSNCHSNSGKDNEWTIVDNV